MSTPLLENRYYTLTELSRTLLSRDIDHYTAFDSQDIEADFDACRDQITTAGYRQDDLTATLGVIGDGEHTLLAVSSSSRPYLESTEYEVIFCHITNRDTSGLWAETLKGFGL